MIEEIKKRCQNELSKLLILVSDDLKSVKTGRAKPSLVEEIKIAVYETTMSLRELAAISAPDPHSLVISPWDKTILQSLEKGIAESNLNLHPVVENDFIRIQIPPLTEETRKDLVKLTNQKLESGRRLLRQIRNEIKKEIEDLEGQPGISEDNIRIWLSEMQEMIEEMQNKLETLGKDKEKELMEI